MNGTNNLNILIVDDEEIVRETLTAMIAHQGHTSECAVDGLSGREALENKNYDGAFIDMRMPGVDGMSLLKWSVEKQLDVPIIIMTGHGEEESGEEALKSGAFAFIHKPFSFAEIKGLLEKIEERAQ
jgi:DNA-binding NtrC family response regulator